MQRCRHHRVARQFSSESESDSELSSTSVSVSSECQTATMIATTMKCLSCQASYESRDSGTCKECYEEANETEEDRKREIEDLKAKVAFLRFWSPFDPQHLSRPNGPCFTDVVLVASSDDGSSSGPTIPVPAHKAVLVSNSFWFFGTLICKNWNFTVLDCEWLLWFWSFVCNNQVWLVI